MSNSIVISNTGQTSNKVEIQGRDQGKFSRVAEVVVEPGRNVTLSLEPGQSIQIIPIIPI